MSLVLVEALSVGASAVATNCDFGPREILQNGKYGHLVPVGDVQAMADAIGLTLMEPRVKFHWKPFNHSRLTARLTNICDSLMNSRISNGDSGRLNGQRWSRSMISDQVDGKPFVGRADPCQSYERHRRVYTRRPRRRHPGRLHARGFCGQRAKDACHAQRTMGRHACSRPAAAIECFDYHNYVKPLKDFVDEAVDAAACDKRG